MNTKVRMCSTCHERAVRTTVLPLYAKSFDHDGRTYELAIPDLEVRQCEHCKSISLGDEANERITQELRAKAGLLSPEELRQKREALGLSQKQLAKALMISEFTLSRWETGAQLQQRSLDRLLRDYFAVPALREYYAQLESDRLEEHQATEFPEFEPVVPLDSSPSQFEKI